MLFTSIVLFLNVFPRYYTGQRVYHSDRHIQRGLQQEKEKYVPKEISATKMPKEKETDFCTVIHIGIVCTGYKSTLLFHTLLKSIFFHRVNPIQLHIITDKNSMHVLNTLMTTWDVPSVNYTFYDLDNFVSDVKWVPNSHYSGVFGMLKLLFPKIIPLEVTDKIMVLDTDMTVVGDIYELWQLFDNFNESQAIGIVENESDYYLTGFTWPAINNGYNSGVLLYQIQKLREINWMTLWKNITRHTLSEYGAVQLADQDIINVVLKKHPELLYEVPCYWNTQLSDHTKSKSCYSSNKVKIVHWNSPRKLNVLNNDRDYFKSLATTYMEFDGNLLRKQLLKCDNTVRVIYPEPASECDEFRHTSSKNFRTLLYFRKYAYEFEYNDVTFVAHLSFDRLSTIEEIAKYWTGPISFTFFVTDAELQRSIEFIENSEMLKERFNIAYHVVFKEGSHYPINLLRNIGLKNVNTPFVFLADIDFVPAEKSCENLREFLKTQPDMKNKALIVPAFELSYYADPIPRNKSRLMKLWKKRRIVPFLEKVWPFGHSPTQYSKWMEAEEPYQVKWEQDFEPYIVVHSNVTKYDQRFVGFGWNKVSHIMELEAQNYMFTVLPNVYIVHRPHGPSPDITRFRNSPEYRMCLQLLKEDFIKGLNRKYYKNFDLKNVTINFPSLVKRRKRNYDVIITTEETNTDYPYLQ